MAMSREQIVFRTPQHPSLGSNHWGGASPLLARNIPRESLEEKYARLNTIRTCDEIFQIESDFFKPKKSFTDDTRPNSRRRLVAKLVWWPRNEKPINRATFGDGDRKRKKKWMPKKMDSKTRWPQGWC